LLLRSKPVSRLRAREKPVVKKYRRFTGRRGAANTGKVIEIAKEKARALNWRVTGAETGKTSK
jgi:hypothetical protein